MKNLKILSLAVFLYAISLSKVYAQEVTSSKPPFQYQQIELGDIKTNYIDTGNGEPLVLVHGGGTWSYSYWPLIERLSKQYRVIAFDLPGHGYTTVKNNNYAYLNMNSIEKNINALTDALGIRSFSLIGHSWGGGIAISYSLHNSSRINKLILLDSAGLDVKDSWEWELFKIPVVGYLATYLINRVTVKNSLKKAFFNKSLVTKNMVDEILRPYSNSYNKVAQHKLSRSFHWNETEEHLNQIKLPTMVIWGEKDEFIGPKYGKLLSQHIDQSIYVEIENAGHNVHEESPDLVAQKVLEFLSEN